jgi:hypothetical protein
MRAVKTAVDSSMKRRAIAAVWIKGSTVPRFMHRRSRDERASCDARPM